MRPRSLLSALLACFFAVSVRAAQDGPPTLLVVDGYQRRPETYFPTGFGIVTGIAFAAIVNAMFDKRATEVATEFTNALHADVLDLGLQFLSAPPGFSSIQSDGLWLLDTKHRTLQEVLSERHTNELFLVRYMAVPAGARFWARLVVEHVSNVDTKVESTLLATAYYVSAIPAEFQRAADGWSDAALQHLEGEVSSSFLELGDLWARIAAERAEGKDRWGSFPLMSEPQGDWTFFCRGLTDCKRERVVRLSGSRAWLGIPGRAALGSVDHTIASQSAAFTHIEWPFIPGTAPRL